MAASVEIRDLAKPADSIALGGFQRIGVFISGHGGMLDRIDSLSVVAPVFFHLTRYFFAT